MSDLRDLLDDAAPEVGDVDVTTIRRRAWRRRAAPRAVAAVAVAVVAVGVVVATSGGDTTNRIKSGNGPITTAPVTTTTEPPTTTTVPPPTTAPPPTVPAGEDRLSSASRLGYAGLGPIKLGMSFDAAVAAAHVTVQTDPTCSVTLYGESGSGVGKVAVWREADGTIGGVDVSDPAIRTISGIGVGSSPDDVLTTYPSAVRQYSDGVAAPPVVITGPGGQVIRFRFATDGGVDLMQLASSQAAYEEHGRC